MTTTDRVWAHAEWEKAERLEGGHDTVEAAIAEGHREYDGAEFWLYECRRPNVLEFVPDATDVTDVMRERAEELLGEAAEEFPDVSEEAEAELKALLDAWAMKHVQMRWWTSEGCAPEIRIAVNDPRRTPAPPPAPDPSATP